MSGNFPGTQGEGNSRMIESFIQKHIDLRKGNPHGSLKGRKHGQDSVVGDEKKKGPCAKAVEGLECHTKESSWK